MTRKTKILSFEPFFKERNDLNMITIRESIHNILHNCSYDIYSIECPKESIVDVFEYLRSQNIKFEIVESEWNNMEGAEVFLAWIENGELNTYTWSVIY